VLRRHRFARRSEQLNADQLNLLDEMIDADIAATEAELEAAWPEPAKRELRQQPKRAPLPTELPRALILHEPESTQCTCGWVCAKCETLIQAPDPYRSTSIQTPTSFDPACGIAASHMPRKKEARCRLPSTLYQLQHSPEFDY